MNRDIEYLLTQYENQKMSREKFLKALKMEIELAAAKMLDVREAKR
jgi:hypothetical protein